VTPETTVQIVAGVLALACVAIIVMRRKAKKKTSAEDDF
jgi:ammonia channel protein AmtB